ncbi:hypothetical protein TVAG_463470 [Trichomonas vaginalis G3]|uniref:RING-type E3 ubiquitin transferase n=1 Tax=Trichomonas vaginalis (strain ATCC PRA-98 / G3) TaxID=412133 RepID=A2EH19_TRIV3|nr:MDM2/MDM4 family protein binding [Trichomonas vaginalis G3]EAY08067.1 hypothetical protein TVAG_463470 [Trichomonas vaginalis G3]KAI5543016.1 MDM2/MDM4 family protein binding [Trichomonas vaginalis G3]|eukprot:XP_001320290.1 hypothetical protein [Trichomonas vaginalis G3]
MNDFVETCPICLEPIAKEGDHQMWVLSCGHLCGYSCLMQWFENLEGAKTCPKCRKVVDETQTRKLFWNGNIPLESSEIDSLNEKHKDYDQKIKFIREIINKLKRDINIYQFESENKDIYHARHAPLIEKKSVNRPSLIFETPITNGFRVSVTPKNIVVTCQNNDGKYGIKFFENQNFTESKFIPLHTQQIRDLSSPILDADVVATVSTDCILNQTSLRTSQIISRTELQAPLWCCEWARPTCIAVGATNGRFFIVDGRGTTPVNIQVEPGPPVTSIIRVDDDFLYVVTPKKGILYDIRSSGFTRCFIDGFNSGCACTGHQQIFASLLRKGTTAEFSLNKFNQSRTKSTIGTFNIDFYKTFARPAVCCCGSTICACAPNGDNFEIFFSSVKEPSLSNRATEKWKYLFYNEQPAPILDISLGKSYDLMLATLSEKNLRVFSIPV